MPSPNERFHASGGVFPQTILWGFGSLSPARAFVEPPPAPSRHHIRRHPRDRRSAKNGLNDKKRD